MTKNVRISFVLVALVTLMNFTSAYELTGQNQRDHFFPKTDRWERATSDENVDSAKLQQALQFARSHNSDAVLVLLNGRILAEQYFNATEPTQRFPIYSVSKSVVSVLIGIAIDENQIAGIDTPVANYLNEWTKETPYGKITIGHLLSMTSGLQNSRRIAVRGAMSRNERQFATKLPIVHTPGEKWDYHSPAYRLLFHVLEEATGNELQTYTKLKLTSPLGMSSTQWSTKKRAPSQHNYMTMTARDAGRFGLMVLANGRWGGTQIVSKEWLRRSTHSPKKSANGAYGYLWWLNSGEHYLLPLNPKKHVGSLWPDCPRDAFAALGKDDQKIFIVPSKGLVVVRFGRAAYSSTLGYSRFDNKFLSLICQSIGN